MNNRYKLSITSRSGDKASYIVEGADMLVMQMDKICYAINNDSQGFTATFRIALNVVAESVSLVNKDLYFIDPMEFIEYEQLEGGFSDTFRITNIPMFISIMHEISINKSYMDWVDTYLNNAIAAGQPSSSSEASDENSISESNRNGAYSEFYNRAIFLKDKIKGAFACIEE